MITTRQLFEKTYEEMIEEALKQIPLYTKEWTNYNASDPGITILENLSSFNELQQTYINMVTAEILENLFKLVGFTRRPGRIARVLLECPTLENSRMIPSNQRFLLGNVSFETNHAMELCGYTIKGIYGEYENKKHDYTFLTDTEVPLSAPIFGQFPKPGARVYFVCDGLPKPMEETIFYCKITDEHRRNPFFKDDKNVEMFASMKWECFTQDGYKEIHFKDSTHCFTTNGEIKFRMSEIEPAVSSELPMQGYVLRGTLLDSHYDIAPQLLVVKGFLFEVWQKETLSICHTFNKFSKIEVVCDLLEEGYFNVFCKEEKETSYRLYREKPEGLDKGRYYSCTRDSFGHYTFEFDKKKFKYAPARIKNAIKIVAYNEFIMRRYSIGIVMGYDEQEIELPIDHLVPETFSIIAERMDENGEALYDFVKPGRMEEEALTFTLDEDIGKIIILDAGNFIEAKLYLCACAITKGEEGNVCEDNTFHAIGFPEEMVFKNPEEGKGGAYRESLEGVRKRFVEDVNKPATSVTAADYEMLLSETSGLCIDKVHAYVDDNTHSVNIVVKPYSKTPFSYISEDYIKAFRRQIEKSRLISTRIHIMQPEYVAVDVSGVIAMKAHMDMCLNQVEEVIYNYLNYETSNRNFGERVYFNELFQLIESLYCVEYVSELLLKPQNMNLATVQSMDVKPIESCLCYPGKLNLEIISHQE